MTTPAHQPEREIPLVVDFGSGVYFRPLSDDRMLVGGHFDCDTSAAGAPDNSGDHSVDPTPSPGRTVPNTWQWEALARAESVASYFRPETKLVDTWEGRYAMTPDEDPIIEESVSGLYTAAGFSGHRFTMAPAAGQLVADLIFDGDCELANLAAYSRRRFVDDRLADESTTDRAIVQF